MENIELKLENKYLSLICLPKHGGKLSSIYAKNQEFELLFQPTRPWKEAYLDANFEDYEACGLDDAFPSIDRETFTFNNKTYHYPDHGEVWSSPMKYVIEKDNIKLKFTSSILPYNYEKTISIVDNQIKLNYQITNTGNEAFPAFWTLHGLFKIEKDMKIYLPKEAEQLINVMNAFNTPLGEKDIIYKYPVDNDYDFSKVVNPQDDNTCSKFYIASKIKEGNCGYIYPSHNLKVNIGFDTKKLPYLGFWKTLGAFRGDYNCALEPSSGFYDNITTAMDNNKCPILQSGDKLNFEIVITIGFIDKDL